MGKFQTGTDLIKQQAERKGGNTKFSPTIFWAKSGDIKTLTWVTDADEVPKVLLHEFVEIPDDSREKGFRYETLLCRKDPSMLDSSGGVCPACDIGHEARVRFVGLAVELDPVMEGSMITGLKIAENKFTDKEGKDRTAPRWGLVIQGAKNFYSYFAAYKERRGTIKGIAWEIQRDGEGIGTKYQCFKIDDVKLPDLTEALEQIPNVETLLEAMGSDEKYSALEGVKPGSQKTFGDAAPESKTNSKTKANDDARTAFEKLKGEIMSGSAEPAEVESY